MKLQSVLFSKVRTCLSVAAMYGFGRLLHTAALVGGVS